MTTEVVYETISDSDEETEIPPLRAGRDKPEADVHPLVAGLLFSHTQPLSTTKYFKTENTRKRSHLAISSYPPSPPTTPSSSWMLNAKTTSTSTVPKVEPQHGPFYHQTKKVKKEDKKPSFNLFNSASPTNSSINSSVSSDFIDLDHMLEADSAHVGSRGETTAEAGDDNEQSALSELPPAVNGRAANNTRTGNREDPRRERRKAKAEFLAGERQAKAVQVSYCHDIQGLHTVEISNDFSVKLPVTPNRAQDLMVHYAGVALLKGTHALLESPTGTGKTLALLCTALAFQHRMACQGNTGNIPRVFWAARTHAQLEHVAHELKRTPYRPMMTLLASRERFCLHHLISRAPNKTEACEKATMNNARDCSYLEKAENMRYPQRHLHLFTEGGPLATYDIEDIVKEGQQRHTCPYHATRDLLQEGSGLILCTYSQLFDPPVRAANGLDPLLEGAIIVVDEAHNLENEGRSAATLNLPLNEMRSISTDLRSMWKMLSHKAKTDKEFNFAVVVCEKLQDIINKLQSWTAEQIGHKGPDTYSSSVNVKRERQGGIKLEQGRWTNNRGTGWSDNTDSNNGKRNSGNGNSKNHQIINKPGPEGYHTVILDLLQLDVSKVCRLQKEIKKMRQMLIQEGYESSAVKSGAINALESVLAKLRFVMVTSGKYHRLLIQNTQQDNGEMDYTLAFVCLLGGVAISPVACKVKSLLMMSGTFGPMKHVVSELSLGWESLKAVATSALGQTSTALSCEYSEQPIEPVTSLDCQRVAQHNGVLENINHVITLCTPHFEHIQNNLLAVLVNIGPTQNGGVLLDGTYKSRDNPAYLESMGNSIINVIKSVPNGILCFFPSTTVLNLSVNSWKHTGIFKDMCKYKEVVVETENQRGKGNSDQRCWENKPLNRDRESGGHREIHGNGMSNSEIFQRTIENYRKHAKTNRGALLFAVMRGRAAEGMDFKDEMARGVIIIGIPYPPVYDIRIQLKRDFNDQFQTELSLPGGSQWYSGQAFQAVNQGLGRLIRHSKDYGVVCLLDYRYRQHKQALPRWSGGCLNELQNSNELPKVFNRFFETGLTPAAERSERTVCTSTSPSVQCQQPSGHPHGVKAEPGFRPASSIVKNEVQPAQHLSRVKREHVDIIEVE